MVLGCIVVWFFVLNVFAMSTFIDVHGSTRELLPWRYLLVTQTNSTAMCGVYVRALVSLMLLFC